MPKLEFFIISHTFSVDQLTNRLSVFEIIDELSPQSLPASVAHLSAITTWHFSKEELGQDFQMSVVVHRPQPLRMHSEHPEKLDFNFTADNEFERLFQSFIGMPIETAGLYVFEVLLNGTHIAEHRIKILEPDPDAREDGMLVYRPGASDAEGAWETNTSAQRRDSKT